MNKIKKFWQNKTVLITGATSGIGFEAALQIAQTGSHVIGVGSSDVSCDKAHNKMLSYGCNVDYIACDLSDQKLVRELAENIKSSYRKIDDYRVFNDLYHCAHDDFLEWLEKNDYEFEKKDIIKDWSYINNRIFAEVANKLFNRNFYYKSIISNDNLVKEALKYFEDANELLN